MSGSILAGLALVLLVQAGWVWTRAIREVRTGERRSLVLLAFAASVGLGALAFAREPGWLGGLAAGLAVVLGGLFLLLQALGRQARVAPAVALGRAVLDFTAPAADGRPFELASLRGRPFLLKFFRGHW